MSESQTAVEVPSPPPYPSPGRISDTAAWTWLAKGWADLKRDPVLSLGYGFVFVALGYGIFWGLWLNGLAAWIPVAVGGFALVGPLMAAGLYEISRRREEGEPVTVTETVFVRSASPLQIAYVGSIMMFVLLVWMRMAMMIYALFVSGTYMPLNDFMGFALGTPQGLAMLVTGTIVGGIIALAIFALTAFSIPMLMHRKMDAFTAVVASIHTLVRNPKAVLLWAGIIAVCVALGAVTGLFGFLVLFPLLGHATWHAYRDVFSTEG